VAKIYRDQIAIVTGAASGIGRQLAAQLVAYGARVWMTDINASLLELSANRLDAPHRTLDVTDAEAFADLVSEVIAAEGRVDYLFNNAGIAVIGHYEQLSLADINRLIDVNLRGVIHGVDAVYTHMIGRRSGHIVNTSSVSGLIPAPGFTAYSATKHAVVGLSRGLRLEAARHGVKVSVVCPGFINTELKQNADYRGVEPLEDVADSPVKFGSPEACARQALRGVARNEAEIVITPHAKGMVAMQRFAPRVSELIGRAAVRRSADKL